MAKNKNRGAMEYGLGKDQIAKATTTAGDTEYAADLAVEPNNQAKNKKQKKNP